MTQALTADALGIGLAAGVAICLGGMWGGLAYQRTRRAQRERLAGRRGRRAEWAALEASLDDPEFDPELIRDAVLAFLGTRRFVPAVRVTGRPRVTILRVVNRPGEAEDRAIVRVRCRVRVPRAPVTFLDMTPLMDPTRIRVDERWTLGRAGDDWRVLSVEGDPLAAPVLKAPLIPDALADDARLREGALREVVAADAHAGPGLADADASPMQQLLDLSLVDGRYLPALLEAELTHVVEAWEAASLGSATPLETVASALAVDVLLHPEWARREAGRLEVQDAVLCRWEPRVVAADQEPPRVTVVVTVEATRRVRSEQDGSLVAGSVEARHAMTPEWVLELVRGGPLNWRLVSSTDPVADLPH